MKSTTAHTYTYAKLVNRTRPNTLVRLLRTLQTPAHAEHIDYLTPQTSPSKLVLPDGRYDAGWFNRFEGELNVEHALANRRFQRWLHIHFDTGRFFIAANLVDLRLTTHLSLAGNTSIVVLDRTTGEYHEAATSDLLWNNPIKVDTQCCAFRNKKTGAFIRMDEDGGVTFDIAVDHLRLQGSARAIFDQPFVQCTRYPKGAGTLQWWGNVALRQGTLTLGNTDHALPEHALGGYDRTLGHRRPIQNWNWLAAVGKVRDLSGKEAVVSLLSATDQPSARPRVNAAKNSLWVDGRYLKLPELVFDYTILSQHSWDTGPWTLTSKSKQARIELVFHPEHRRREKRSVPLIYDVDFNQYYGTLAGTITLLDQERTLIVDHLFGLVEDAWMVM